MHDNFLHLMDICSKYSSLGAPYRIYINVFMYAKDIFCVYLYQTREHLMSCEFKSLPHSICIYGDKKGFDVSSNYIDPDPQGVILPHPVKRDELEKYLDYLFLSYEYKRKETI